MRYVALVMLGISGCAFADAYVHYWTMEVVGAGIPGSPPDHDQIVRDASTRYPPILMKCGAKNVREIPMSDGITSFHFDVATLRQGPPVKLVADLLEHGAQFFEAAESACDELHRQQRSSRSGNELEYGGAGRSWTELRIRRPELVPDSLTLPIQRLSRS